MTRDNRPNAPRAATADPATPRRAPGRNDRGLTTLEWLLIVAAVAGLAALAVVLVQNVVDETAEQISGGSARLTAARVAADAINSDSDSDEDRGAKCNRLQITYGDAFASDADPRAALWSDPDSDDNNKNGKCFIVYKALKDDMAMHNGTGASTSCKGLSSTEASRGGGTLEHASAARPRCHLK